jgi:hypothetical protein
MPHSTARGTPEQDLALQEGEHDFGMSITEIRTWSTWRHGKNNSLMVPLIDHLKKKWLRNDGKVL